VGFYTGKLLGRRASINETLIHIGTTRNLKGEGNMKRTLLLVGVLCLVLSVAVSGQGLKGKMLISGYGGYTIGMGDVFDDFEEPGSKFSNSAGINFGGIFHYGINEKMMIGGELGFQSYKSEMESTVLGNSSDSETKLNFAANGLYLVNETEKNAFFITGGVGFYDYGSTEVGFFGGILYRWAVSPTVFVFAMPRIHLILADSTFELLQISGGVQIPIGPKK